MPLTDLLHAGTQGPAPRSPRRWAPARDGHRAGRRVRLRRPPDHRRRRSRDVVQPRRQAQRPGALPRDVRPHGRRDAGPRRDRAGRLRVRPGPRRRRRRLRRGPLRPRAQHREGADPRRGDGGGARRLPAWFGRHRPDDLRASCRRCARRPAATRSPSSRCASATPASSGSTSPAPRPGYPPTRHLDAFQYIQRENFHTTIHAGEAFGLPSIWEALQFCGAERLGHGVRIVDDIDPAGRLRHREARPARHVRPRPPHPARAVPDLQRQHRRGADDRRPPDRHAAPAALPGHPQHRQPADERHVDDQGDGAARRRVRLGPRRLRVADGQRDEVSVRPVPRAAAA